MVKIRDFRFEEDYEDLCDWWEKAGSFAPHPEHLPKTRLIAYEEKTGDKICAGFLYNTDSAICIFEFFVSNPDLKKDIRDLGLNTLIAKIISLAKEKEYGMIYTSTSIPKFVKRLEDQGFLLLDKGQNHLFKKLRG